MRSRKGKKPARKREWRETRQKPEREDEIDLGLLEGSDQGVEVTRVKMERGGSC